MSGGAGRAANHNQTRLTVSGLEPSKTCFPYMLRFPMLQWVSVCVRVLQWLLRACVLQWFAAMFGNAKRNVLI